MTGGAGFIGFPIAVLLLTIKKNEVSFSLGIIEESWREPKA